MTKPPCPLNTLQPSTSIFSHGTPVFRDIRIADVTCTGCTSIGTLTALPEMPVTGFTLTNAAFRNAGRDLTVRYFADPVLDYTR